MRPAAASGPRPRQEGFSLVEIMVAMIVMSGIASSVFFFISSQSALGTRSQDLLKGLNLGKLAMDSLKVAEYDSLVAGSDTVAGRFIRSWRISVGMDGGGIPTGRKQIDVTIHWPLTADRNISFSSIMSDARYKEDP
jgi:prepilin-type N-terminal cleavage/methylation domain-containing protein